MIKREQTMQDENPTTSTREDHEPDPEYKSRHPAPPDAAPRNVFKRRLSFLSLFIGWFIGMMMGAIVGARYLKWTPTMQILSGLLPFNPSNQLPVDLRSLPLGATKQEVIKQLNLEQVIVLPGNVSDACWSWVMNSPAVNSTNAIAGKDRVVEIWLIPRRQNGLSYFVTLGFDQTQKLCLTGGGDFIMGFPLKPYGYDRGT